MQLARRLTALLAVLTLAALSSTSALSGSALSGPSESDADFDRLDGKGPSGKKVNVVEWEGNLEVHVYPAGSLKGLALKLEKRDQYKPVMVIGYRFDNSPRKPLIRRAILGIDLREGFNVYRDSSTTDYDKLVITNNGLGAPLALYKLDKDPSQLYPDGHPALAQGDKPEARMPASSGKSESGAIRPFFMRETNGRSH